LSFEENPTQPWFTYF